LPATASSGHSSSAPKKTKRRGWGRSRLNRPAHRQERCSSATPHRTRRRQRICEALRAAGIEVWFDESEPRGGDAWDRSIREQINECALFIPIISTNAHARTDGYFRFEWKLAIERSHRMAPDQAFLLPVVIDNTPQGDKRIPDRFRELQWTRLPGGHATPACVERVRRLLTRDLASARAVATPPASGVAQISTPSNRALLWVKPAVWVTGGVPGPRYG